MILVSESVWILPSFVAATPAHGDHVRAIGQVDVKLFFKRLAKLFAAHLLDQLRKSRDHKSPLEAESYRPGQPRGNPYRLQHAPQPLQTLERLRNSNGSRLSGVVAKSLQIKHRKHWATLHKNSGTSRWNRLSDGDAHQCRNDARTGDKCAAERA